MSRESRLAELLQRYQEVRQRGETFHVDDLCKDDPDLRPELEQQVALLNGVDDLLGTASGGPATTPLPDGAASPAGAIPNYELVGWLGGGGMGVVYKARQMKLGRVVALKMIHAGKEASPEHRQRFLTEAQASAKLQHPNIVQIYEFGEAGDRLFLALEYVEGPTLAEAIKSGAWAMQKKGMIRKAAELVETLARAVKVAHERGIIHRDLKPSNILLTLDGQPKIADFGLAKQLSKSPGLTYEGAILGTPGYMSPEQAQGQADRIGPPTDVFGLGAILYELLAGQPPFRGETPLDTVKLTASGELVPPSRLQPKVPRYLETICLKCLEKEPKKRYQTASALADDLHKYLKKWRLAYGLAAALAVVAVVGIGGWIIAAPSSPPPSTSGAARPAALQDDRLILRIWSRDNLKRGLRIGVDPGALPALSGDMIQMEVRLNQPGHIYLLAIDAQGDVTPLYPWHVNAEKMTRTLNDSPPLVSPAADLTWPSKEARRGLPLDDRGGLETILLLARRTPLSATVSLASLVGPLPLPPAPLGHAEEFVLRGADEGQAAIRVDSNRGFQQKLGEIDEPLEKLLERLRPEFELLRAVRFAHQGR